MALINKLDAIADAIREKTGRTEELTLDEMAAEILTIPSSAYGGRAIPQQHTYAISKQLSTIGNAIRVKTGFDYALTLDEMPEAIRSISDTPRSPTASLNYKSNDDGTGYLVTSIYNPNQDVIEVIIPAQYRGLPVIGIDDSAFRNPMPNDGRFMPDVCETDKVERFYLSDGIQTIGDYAFCSIYSRDKLTKVRLPESLTSIGKYAFQYCTKISSLHVPDSVASIGEGAFSYCSSLVSFRVPKSLKVIPREMLYACGDIEEVIIPEGVEVIQNFAFDGCYKLGEITLPSTITSIGEYGLATFVSTGISHIYVPWSEGEVAGAPWGATRATIHYNHTA